MEPSSLKLNILADLNSLGATISDGNNRNTARKKSRLRLNDQRVPKPGDINMATKMIKIATPKEHPYASHISRFAMFPSFRPPDDPNTGVRAAFQPFLSPLIPNSIPKLTLLSKTIGGPYRHEILETPTGSTKKAVTWTGEDGFLDHAKPTRGRGQVIYPSPPKTVLPNGKLRDRDLSLSERTSNMLRNLERSHWLTSYQMHYTGSGPVNPLKIDDFMEKMSDLSGISPNSAPLRERSYPVFVPSKPTQGWTRQHWSQFGRNTCSSTDVLLNNPSPTPNQCTATATINQHRPQEIISEHTEAGDLNKMGHSERSSGSTDAGRAQLSHEVFCRQQVGSQSCVYQGQARENCKVHFDESSLEANGSQIAHTEQKPDLNSSSLSQRQIKKSSVEMCNEPRCNEMFFKVGRNPSSHSQPAIAKYQAGAEPHAGISKAATEVRELPRSICNPCILPRPPVLPATGPVETTGAVVQKSTALGLLDLQHSFSKTAAHHSFNSSITRASVNLRDNVVTGKKHDFYGINCNYLHG